MIRLRYLQLQSFRSFYDETVIDFPESGLLLIRGASLDHGDSSGSGKSSIILAIAYALGICNQPATELQSWGADRPLQVKLTLYNDTQNTETIIYRGKVNKIELTALSGKNTITGAKAIDAEIRSILGLDPEVLQAITYREQNSRGSFLSKTDAEKKEFLTGLLGLKQIEVAIEESEKALREHQAALPLSQQRAESISKHVWPDPAPALPTENLDRELDEVDGEIGTLTLALAEPEPEFVPNPRIEELQKMKEMAQRGWVQEKAAVEAARKQVEDRRYRALLAKQDWEKNVTSWGRDASDYAERVRSLEKGTCPTCHQAWHDETELENTKCSLDSAAQMLVQLGDGTQWDADLNAPTHGQTSERLEALDRARQEFDAALTELRVEDQKRRPVSEKPNLQKQRQMLQQTRQRIVLDIDERRKHNAHIERERIRMEANRAADARVLETVREEIRATEQKISAERDFQESVGRKGFLGVIFGDILQEIKAEANQRLAQLANVSQVTLDLVTETETKAGTAKKSITPVFYVNGNETRFSSLSGGMQTSVDLVVDLALMTVVQRRTGTIPGWLFLDEAFNGQGVVTKEASLEALRAYAQEKLIIVIDHSSETKEFFSQVLTVESNGGRSKISALE